MVGRGGGGHAPNLYKVVTTRLLGKAAKTVRHTLHYCSPCLITGSGRINHINWTIYSMQNRRIIAKVYTSSCSSLF
jgi:hypothetical protein